MATKKSIKAKEEDAARMTEKGRYYAQKRRILGWEKTNFTRLAILQAPNGWYKMFGNSAIIFVGQIAKRLKLNASLTSDTDYELTTDVPVCLIKNFAKLEDELKSVKIFRSSMEEGVYVFDLGYKVDAGDLVGMQKEEERLKERANKLVLPTEVHPGLRNELRILTMRLYEVARLMNPVARALVGDSLLGICSRMFENFVEAANGHADMRQYLKTTIKDLRRVDAKLLLVSDLRLVADDKVYNLILQVGKVQRKAAAALDKVEKGK